MRSSSSAMFVGTSAMTNLLGVGFTRRSQTGLEKRGLQTRRDFARPRNHGCDPSLELLLLIAREITKLVLQERVAKSVHDLACVLARLSLYLGRLAFIY